MQPRTKLEAVIVASHRERLEQATRNFPELPRTALRKIAVLQVAADAAYNAVRRLRDLDLEARDRNDRTAADTFGNLAAEWTREEIRLRRRMRSIVIHAGQRRDTSDDIEQTVRFVIRCNLRRSVDDRKILRVLARDYGHHRDDLYWTLLAEERARLILARI